MPNAGGQIEGGSIGVTQVFRKGLMWGADTPGGALYTHTGALVYMHYMHSGATNKQ